MAHAFWSPGRGFCFWAEDSRLVGRGRRADGDDELGPRRHGFAVAASGLPTVLGLTAEAAARAEPVRLRLLLPTEGNRPLPSTPTKGTAGRAVPANVLPLARAGRRGVSRAPALHPWLVPTLRLPAGVALELLLSHSHRHLVSHRAATASAISSRDSGFSSWRTVHFSRWPISGPPPYFADPADYQQRITAVLGTGQKKHSPFGESSS